MKLYAHKFGFCPVKNFIFSKDFIQHANTMYFILSTRQQKLHIFNAESNDFHSPLKVHKREKFFVSDIEFFTIL